MDQEQETREGPLGFDQRGSNQSGMRDRNERLVLSILRRQGPLAKAEIARKTGLSAQTVSVIMRALENDGLLMRGEKRRGRVGQPSVPMMLAPNGALFFGLKVGRRSAELLLVNFVGEILARRNQTYRYPTPEGTLSFARDAMASILQDRPQKEHARIAGLGIAIPFFLWNWASVIGIDPEEMEAWRSFDLQSELQDLVAFPVFLGNDATCACGAELVFGRHKAPKDFLYLYIGYFIGGGVVQNSVLNTGSSGNAGAIGPFPVRGADGQFRQLVDVASLIGLERRLLDAGANAQQMWEATDTWDIDPSVVQDWLDEAVPALAQTVLAAISIFDFPHVLIDGSMPMALRQEVVDRVRAQLLGLNLSGLTEPEIVPGSIGADARPLGAAGLALSKRFMLET